MTTSEKLKVLAVGGHPSDVFPNIGGTVAKHDSLVKTRFEEVPAL